MNVGLSSTVCSIVLNNMLCEGCRSCWLSIKDVWANEPGEVTWRPRAVPSWHLSPTFTPRLEVKSILKLRLLALKIAPLVMWGLQGMPLILYASLLLAMISVSMLSVFGNSKEYAKYFIKVLPRRTPVEKPKTSGSLHVF